MNLPKHFRLRPGYFLFGAFIGVVSLFSQVKPVEAFAFPSIADIPSLIRLIPFPNILPLNPLPTIKPLKSFQNPFASPTLTPTLTTTPSFTPTPTQTPTPTPTTTPTPTLTLTPTETPTHTPTETPTPTPSETPVPTETPTSTPTETPTPTLTPTPTGILGSVVINEIMWPGSTPNPSDEWIELKNMTSSPIDLTNWVVENLGESGSPNITIPSGVIEPNNYFLISNNTRENSIIDVDSDYVTTAISLLDSGEQLTLKNNFGTTIDIANQIGSWFAGSTEIPSKSMSRKIPPSDGISADNWFTSSGSLNLDLGATESATPKADNI